MESCCTCAVIQPPTSSQAAEKALPQDRRVECCGRIICGKCIQASSAPPPYTPTATPNPSEPHEKPAHAGDPEKSEAAAQDTLHFLDHEHDSITSLSLKYGVPATALRRTNNLTSDHLLVGRKTILIPAEYYRAGVSLSPRPVDGEEEELRKSKIRRFMTSCKVSDYDVALLYLEQSAYDLGASIEAFLDDEAWERSHPMQRSGKAGPVRKGPKNRGPFWRGL
ncbi:hypothetical protein PLIIFM63780_000825 [Purpureocillium lilacinum]|nr:hypothetical protein PLIIFM63780_000825 [Purpureocillium lilacinum]